MKSAFSRFPYLIVFTLLYLAIAAFFYISRGNYEFIAYLGVTIAVGALVIGTIDRSHLDRVALWALSIWGLLHMLGGILPVGDGVLYGWRIVSLVDRGGDFFILKMDQVIHFYGFAAAAIVMHQLIASRTKPNTSHGMLIFFAWVGAMGLGAINEVVEFLAFISLEQTGVGDLYNTGLDLNFNLLGALAGSFFENYRWRQAPR